MHLNPQWLRLLSVVRQCFCCCWFVVYCCSHLGVYLFIPCFVVQCYVSFLDLQSTWRGRESWLLYFICLPDVLWLLFSVTFLFAVGWSAVCDYHTLLLFCGNLIKTCSMLTMSAGSWGLIGFNQIAFMGNLKWWTLYPVDFIISSLVVNQLIAYSTVARYQIDLSAS